MKVFKTGRTTLFALLCLAGSTSGTAWCRSMGAAGSAPQGDCSSVGQSPYPKASISNGVVNAIAYLPDPKKGYYRGVRFDWSGVVGCLAYKGHTYFGVWFKRYDPYLHDSIIGPVEEFRSGQGGPLHYDQANSGGLFVKPGVGVLRKIDDAPFQFATPYPLIDGGRWTVDARRDRISFRQDLQSSLGIAYIYKKNLKLVKSQPVLVLEHELKNTGTQVIDTEVYNHDFFVLDGAPTGPGVVVRFPFEPKADSVLKNGARIDGKEIVYDRELESGQAASAWLTGYSSDVSDFDFIVENRNTGAGVEESASLPISRLNFWSIRTTVCPEGYVHLKILPGQTARWTVRYRFFAR